MRPRNPLVPDQPRILNHEIPATKWKSIFHRWLIVLHVAFRETSSAALRERERIVGWKKNRHESGEAMNKRAKREKESGREKRRENGEVGQPDYTNKEQRKWEGMEETTNKRSRRVKDGIGNETRRVWSDRAALFLLAVSPRRWNNRTRIDTINFAS